MAEMTDAKQSQLSEIAEWLQCDEIEALNFCVSVVYLDMLRAKMKADNA